MYVLNRSACGIAGCVTHFICRSYIQQSKTGQLKNYLPLFIFKKFERIILDHLIKSFLEQD